MDSYFWFFKVQYHVAIPVCHVTVPKFQTGNSGMAWGSSDVPD